MQIVRLASEIDLEGWRRAARTLRAARVAPDEVIWTVDGQGDLLDDDALEPRGADPAFRVPREFLHLAATAICHRSDERFALLYRLLSRLGGEPMLLRVADPDTDHARELARAVMAAAQRMRAFAGFQAVGGAPQTKVGWFEPAHRVTETVAPFFARRFGPERFSLLTPDACAHWDGQALAIAPGADPAEAPRGDGLEAWWRARFASVFGPDGRLKPDAGNLMAARPIPEAVPIPHRTAAAMARPSSAAPDSPSPSPRVVRAALRTSRDAPYEGQAVSTLDEIEAAVQFCRRCDLYRDATQGVAGEGPARARLMLVGEQPGDQEDLAGKPFVGPAGQVLDRALAAAGVPRDEAYVTNAVKHFKHELRGKKRIHKTPNTGEVTACRWWLDNERRILRPRVIVALGATAALSVFGKPTPIGKSRQQALQLPDQAQGVVTWHPSFLLRVPDAAAKAKAYAEFVADLEFAWKLAA